jgi:predicted glycoside hydrolase/deacetylase ChbG (UPF0249 family)
LNAEPKTLLIINADDLGYDPAVTRGMIEAMRRGVVSSATFMVNTPFSEDAAKESDGLALGLHLNLARHRPCWSGFPAALLQDGALHEPNAGALPAEVVEAEVGAQLERFERLLGRPATHVDVHKHLHRNPAVLEGLCRAARARDLPVRAIDEAMRKRIIAAGVRTTQHFIGDAADEAYWTWARFEEHLAKLPAGTVELMCHPGYRPSMTRSGYSAQREVELATFLDPRARERIERAGAKLGTFADLPRS